MADKNLIIQVDIDFENNTVFIAEESSSGCKYKFNNKRSL